MEEHVCSNNGTMDVRYNIITQYVVKRPKNELLARAYEKK